MFHILPFSFSRKNILVPNTLFVTLFSMNVCLHLSMSSPLAKFEELYETLWAPRWKAFMDNKIDDLL